MIRTGIVGCGYWGGNIARNLFLSDKFEFVAAFDQEETRSRSFSKNYTGLVPQPGIEHMLQDEELEAVVLTTPASTHFKLANDFLKAGKHVLVEKPACESVAEMKQLHKVAKDNGKVLMVDHTYLYSGPVAAIKHHLDQGLLGKMFYIDSVRINLGKIQPDINVIWDLATHDISISNYLVGLLPESVQVSAASHLPNGLKNVAYISINYPGNILVNIHVSWSSPIKRREMIIGGSDKMLVYNDLKKNEKLVLHHCGHEMSESKDGWEVAYTANGSEPLLYEDKEPLKEVIEQFAESITTTNQAASQPAFDIGVIQTLEAAQKSADQNGLRVFL